MNLSAVLFSLARRLMPPGRGEWLDAMRAESHGLDGGERFRWAFGCIVAALKQRFVLMETGTLRVARWVILVEAIGCFGALTLACGFMLYASPAFLRVTPEALEKDFQVGSHIILAMSYWTALKTFIGPIGLVLGLRCVLTGRGITSRVLGLTLIGFLVVKALVGTCIAFFVLPGVFRGDIGLMLLLTILPIVGLWHLMYLARPTAGVPPTAA